MDREHAKGALIFLSIGVLNTALNWAIMLVLYQKLGLGHWPSSAVGYTVTSALSFILNRRFSFKSAGPVGGDLVRFALVIGCCYFAANWLAIPLVNWAFALPALSPLAKWSGQTALIFGNVVFTGLNYLGQRFFAFARR